MIRPVWAEVDLQAIVDNLAAFRAELGRDTKLMAVVKANAYGHGLIPVAKTAAMSQADRLGVAMVEEAIELREAGIDIPIQILSEPPAEAAEKIAAYDLIPTVYSKNIAAALSRAAESLQSTIKIHLKVDTGMHRVGVLPNRAGELYNLINRLPGLLLEGVFTHFACADSPDNSYTTEQLQTFLALKPELPNVPIWHAANSAATLFFPETRLDMARIGIAMYGLQPSAKQSPLKLDPALALKTKISFIQQLNTGDGISYGLTYKATRPTTVAILPIGYGDGYSRLLSNRGKVLVAGRRVRVIGNVCMDQLIVELDQIKAAMGDEVVLIGNQGEERISAEELATLVGTINYEIVCMINKRVARLYKKE